jgi:hypothetical protein
VLSKLVRLGALFLSLVLVVSACGGDRSGGPKGTPAEVVGGAPAHTIAAKTARVVIDGTDVAATGTVDFAAGVTRLSLSDGSTVVLAGGEVYRRPSGATRFDRIPEAALPDSFRRADPVAAVDLFRAVESIRSDGGVEVRGASVFAYLARVNPAAALAAAPPERRAAVARLVDGAGTGVLQIELAVDPLGRVRRMQLPVPLKVGPPRLRSDAEPVVVTIDLADYGVTADASVPTT